MAAYGYTPYRTSNAGWGAAATYAKQATDLTRRQGGVYTPTNPGWGAGSSQVPSYMPKVINTAGAQPGYGGFKAPTYDWRGDPALLEVQALAGKNRAEAKAASDDQLRKTILQSGIGALAEKLFGSDTAFVESVKNAPFSGMGSIRNAYEGKQGLVNQTNEDLNKDNLFFSSYRTDEVLPQVFRQRQQDEFDLTNQTQSSIDSVNAAYANRMEQIRMQEVEAERQAQWAAMMASLAGGGGGPSGYYSGGGDTSTQAYNDYLNSLNPNGWNPAALMSAMPYEQWAASRQGTWVSTGGGGGGGGWAGPVGAVGRPGEWADLPVKMGWDPSRNSDAEYDMSGATWVGDGYVGPQGQRYDDKGRIR